MAGINEFKRAILEFLPLVVIACLLANNPYDGDEIYKSISQAGGLAICRILMARYGKKQ